MSESRAAISVGGVPFEVSRLEEASNWLVDIARQPDHPGAAVRLANAYCVALASRVQDYGALLRDQRGINFPDGLPVVASMRLLARSQRPQRVRGPSFFRAVLENGAKQGLRHFFLGTTPQTLDRLTNAIHAEYPDVEIAGSYSPPFAPIDDAYLDDLVARARGWNADVVWVGLGTPKQDFVAQALADRNGIVAVGVGAAFDFVAGTAREAPRWVQRSGFEWAYRFSREPRRLWQRYIFGNARFVFLICRQLITGTVRPIRPSQRDGLTFDASTT